VVNLARRAAGWRLLSPDLSTEHVNRSWFGRTVEVAAGRSYRRILVTEGVRRQRLELATRSGWRISPRGMNQRLLELAG
jgi:hypothetical protein